MSYNNLVKSKEKLLPNKWYYRCIFLLLGLSALLVYLVGWTGLIVSGYAVLLYLNGRGRMMDKKTGLNLAGGFFLKRYDRRGV